MSKRDLSHVKKRTITCPKETQTHLQPPPPHQYTLQKRPIICQKETDHTSQRDMNTSLPWYCGWALRPPTASASICSAKETYHMSKRRLLLIYGLLPTHVWKKAQKKTFHTSKRDVSYIKRDPNTSLFWYYGWALRPPPPHQYVLQKRPILCPKETYHISKRDVSYVKRDPKHTPFVILLLSAATIASALICSAKTNYDKSKRDLWNVKKRPITRQKETYHTSKRDLSYVQNWPITRQKETYHMSKSDIS